MRDGGRSFRAGVDVFVPRNCRVEDLEVDLTARHLSVKVEGWGVFRRHWAYTCRSDEASWHLLDDDGRRKVRVDCRFRGLKTNGPKTKESVTQRGQGTSSRCGRVDGVTATSRQSRL